MAVTTANVSNNPKSIPAAAAITRSEVLFPCGDMEVVELGKIEVIRMVVEAVELSWGMEVVELGRIKVLSMVVEAVELSWDMEVVELGRRCWVVAEASGGE